LDRRRELACVAAIKPSNLADLAEGAGFTAPSTGKADKFNIARLAIRGPHYGIQILNGFWRELNAKLLNHFAFERRFRRFLLLNLAPWEIPVLVLTNTNKQ
jgi:hypothetical protein